MKNTLLLLIACLCLATGCNQPARKKTGDEPSAAPAQEKMQKEEMLNPDDDALPAIQAKKAMKNPVKLTLTDFGEEVAYIPLETTDLSVVDVSAITSMSVSDHTITVGSRRGIPIKVFDKKTGRFIRQIGNIGNGPGEYPDGKNFHIDPKTQKIYIFTHVDRYQCYDMQGEYLGNITWKGLPAGFRVSTYFLGEALYCYVTIPNAKTTVLANRYDIKTGEKTDALPFRWGNEVTNCNHKAFFGLTGAETVGGSATLVQNTDDQWTYAHQTVTPFWYLHDQLHVKDVFCDTVYTIDGFKNLKPEIRFDLGADNRFGRYENAAAMTSKYMVTRLLESENLFYFVMMKNMYDLKAWLSGQYQPVCGIYNKRTGITRVMKSAYIANNRPGFPGFIIYNISTSGEFVVCYQAADLVDARERIPEAEQPDWLKRLKEDDNPVILLIK